MSAPLCFYPNGNPSLEEDIPCGTGDGVGCCPLNWSCQPNGLCYLEDQNYYGRYTCTDKNWGPGCPNICTYGNTAAGNEAVLECSPGSFCCDTNRPELSGGTNCCDASPSRFSIDGVNEVNSTSIQSTTPTEIYPSTSASFMAYPTYTTSAQPSYTEEDSTPTGDSTYPTVSPTLTCDIDSGEELCGSICCATEQYCAFAGQCSAVSDSSPSSSGTVRTSSAASASSTLVCDADSGEGLCGSICCVSGQSCAFAGHCSATSHSSRSSSDTVRTSSIASTKTSTSAIRSQYTAFSSSVTRTSLSSPSIDATPGTTTLLPNSGKPTIPSTATTPTTTVVPTPAATNLPITKSTGFKAGVSVGATVAVAFVLLVIFLCVRRRRSQKQKSPQYVYDTVVAEPPPVGPYPYDSTRPPRFNPYEMPFPENQAPVDSNSCLGPELVPDNQRQTPRPQPVLRRAPAQNPYAYPTTPHVSMSEPNLGLQHPERWQSHSATPPPSYTPQDQPERLRRFG